MIPLDYSLHEKKTEQNELLNHAIKAASKSLEHKKSSSSRERRNEPGDVVLARERGGLAQIPNAKQRREDKRGATSLGEKLSRENERGLLGIRIV